MMKKVVIDFEDKDIDDFMALQAIQGFELPWARRVYVESLIKDMKQKVIEYVNAEKTLLNELSKKPMYGNDCGCHGGEHEVISIINETTEEPEIEKFCLSCGGSVWNRLL